EALHDEESRHAAGSAAGRARVVLGDGATADDATADVHQKQRRLQDVAPDVVEVDVDALRARRGERAREVRGLVVDRRVEAELLGQPRALVVRPGETHGTTTANAGELAGDRASGPGRRRDQHGLTRPRRADVQETEVRRLGGDAETGENGGERPAALDFVK